MPFNWERIKTDTGEPGFMGIKPERYIYRAKVLGGWLVGIPGSDGSWSITFYPDPDHQWDGNTLE